VFLSEVPLLFRRGILPLDVALIQVSPPDKHGSALWAPRWTCPWRRWRWRSASSPR
jgi:hypothetical protein